jgi:hypothetical protein
MPRWAIKHLPREDYWTFVVDGQVYQLPRDPFFQVWCTLWLIWLIVWTQCLKGSR